MNTMNDHEYAYRVCISHHASRASRLCGNQCNQLWFWPVRDWKASELIFLLPSLMYEYFMYTLPGTDISNSRVANHWNAGKLMMWSGEAGRPWLNSNRWMVSLLYSMTLHFHHRLIWPSQLLALELTRIQSLANIRKLLRLAAVFKFEEFWQDEDDHEQNCWILFCK